MFPNCTLNALNCERLSVKKRKKQKKSEKNLRLATAFYICYNSGKKQGRSAHGTGKAVGGAAHSGKAQGHNAALLYIEGTA